MNAKLEKSLEVNRFANKKERYIKERNLSFIKTKLSLFFIALWKLKEMVLTQKASIMTTNID
jgi:hypothetical protein